MRWIILKNSLVGSESDIELQENNQGKKCTLDETQTHIRELVSEYDSAECLMAVV
jgi:hypothetical protein